MALFHDDTSQVSNARESVLDKLNTLLTQSVSRRRDVGKKSMNVWELGKFGLSALAQRKDIT